MIRGQVIGTVWGARRSAGLVGRKLALVREEECGVGTDRVVVAIDTLDAPVGARVVVSFGSAARRIVAPGAGRSVLADAAIAQVVEGQTCS